LDRSISTFKRTKIFAIGAPEECRALSWGFRQSGVQSSSPEVTEASLSDLSAAQNEADFLVCFVDLGQPVPINALSEIGPKIAGTFIFTQPTPTQLLTVFQLPHWSAISWDGSSTEILCQLVSHKVSEAQRLLREKSLLRDAIRVLDQAKETPSFLEWINPPPGRNTNANFALNPTEMVVTIGSDGSRSHYELPTAAKGTLAELKFVEGRWLPRAIDPCVQIENASTRRGLMAGEMIKIGDFLLAARLDERSARLNSLISQETGLAPEISLSDAAQSLTDYIQHLLIQSVTGEVHVTSGLRRATICFHNGCIDQSFAGPVRGEKALERVLTWTSAIWKYNHGSFSIPDEPSLKMMATDFAIFQSQVKRNWERLEALAPPTNITLDVDPSRFLRVAGMTPQQSRVLAAVSEFRLVRDILNYCPLRDLEIYDELIGFRKSGLIRIAK